MRVEMMGAAGAAAVMLTALMGVGHGASGPGKHGPGKPGAAKAAGGTAPVTASVHGAGRIDYIESLEDDIRFTVHAESKPFSRPVPGIPTGIATDATGIVKFSHGAAGMPEPMKAEARVDCLVTSGRTATLTAVITTDGAAFKAGQRLGFSVQQGDRGKREKDRLGFSWGAVNIDPEVLDEKGEVTLGKVGPCMAPAPFTTVRTGGFKVVHADLRKTPKAPVQASAKVANGGAEGHRG
ncbi:hypothetical protein [Streptomyces sp. NPDC051561]|uniref:hypothetical protein n=1 Tax=Streptomyces sp. NPDC051561 TaxID=3365658 RepID=UPI0037BA8440